MISHVRRDLTEDDFQIVRQFRSDRVFNAFTSSRAISDRGIHFDLDCYSRAPCAISVRARVPRMFALPPQFSSGITPKPLFSGAPIGPGLGSPRYEAYITSLRSSPKLYKNGRVPVWPSDVLNIFRNRRAHLHEGE